MHPHAVVIGGTGMLRRASVAIARQSQLFTAVARTPASLGALDHAIGDVPGRERFYLNLDWDQPDQFLSSLSQHFGELMAPSLVLAWLHDVKLGPRVAGALSRHASHCDFFQVMGSAGASPMSGAAVLRNQLDSRDDLAYYQIVLGFKRERGSSRWLTDEEISDGVLDAISTKQPSYLVGSVTPWEERP